MEGLNTTSSNESINVVDDGALEIRGESALKDSKETIGRIKTKLENGNLTKLDNDPVKKEETTSLLKTGFNFIKAHLPEILLVGGVALEVTGLKTVEYDPAYIDRMLMSLQTGLGLAEAATGFLLIAGSLAVWTENSLKEAKERKASKMQRHANA